MVNALNIDNVRCVRNYRQHEPVVQIGRAGVQFSVYMFALHSTHARMFFRFMLDLWPTMPDETKQKKAFYLHFCNQTAAPKIYCAACNKMATIFFREMCHQWRTYAVGRWRVVLVAASCTLYTKSKKNSGVALRTQCADCLRLLFTANFYSHCNCAALFRMIVLCIHVHIFHYAISNAKLDYQPILKERFLFLVKE